MKNSTASALTWLAAILLGVGLLMMSPAGSFLAFILAALSAVAPALFSTKKIRIVAVILLIVALLLAAGKYPELQSERNTIRKRGKISRVKPLNLPAYSSFGNSAIHYQRQDVISRLRGNEQNIAIGGL
jgi:4-amino-4-deoxy-L-arabinose transferase-like glycosyltransferase